MIHRSLVFLILLTLGSPPLVGLAAPRVQGEGGLIGRNLSQAEAYLEPKLRSEYGSYFLSGRLRAITETDRTAARFEIRDSYLQLEKGNWRGRLGFQSLSWGETYGLFIADLPNPRDWSDPRLLDIAYVKKPVFMAQLQWFGEWLGGASSLQLFFTPITREQEISTDWSAAPSGTAEAAQEAEGGFRMTRLFDSGLDASAFVISHLDRTPSLSPGRVLSAGLTGTQALSDAWIFRTDQVWSRDTQWDWRGVAALQWSPEPSLFLVGQLQHDPRFLGASALVRYQGFAPGLDLDVFGLVGLDQRSTWLQPKITYTRVDGLSFSLRYDWVDSSPRTLGGAQGTSFLETLPQADRILLWISHRI